MATRGLLWVSYPAFNRYYGDTKTASVPSRLRITLGVQFLGRFHFLGDHEPKAGQWPRILLSRCDPFRLVPWRQEALPASLETPSPLCPGSKAPGGPESPDHYGAPVLPPLFLARRLPHYKLFEAQSHGFTARCLRLKAPSLTPAKARFRWTVNPCRAGWFPPGLCRCFRLLATSSSPLGSLFRFASALPASQGFGWRQEICFLREALEVAVEGIGDGEKGG